MEENLGIISLATASLSVSEDNSTLFIPVERTGNINGEASFNYSIVSSSAVAGEDFVASSGTLTFQDGQSIIEIPVSIIDDSLPEIDETFGVAIGEPSPEAELGGIRTAIITIEDNDVAAENSISFSQAEFTIDEDNGEATITVFRFNGNGEEATVEYSTSDNYARSGSDYVATSGTLTFSPNATSQTFTIPIVNDDLLEIDESIFLELNNPVGANLGAQSVSELTIVEEDTSPYLFEEKIIASALSEGSETQFAPAGPTAFDWSNDGAMFIAKLDGIVRVYDGGQLLEDPFIDISDQVNTGGQRGLLGLAVDPNFPQSPYVYLAFTYDPPGVEKDLANAPRVTRVIRVEADPTTGYNTALPNSEVILLETGLVGNFHAAGALKFGSDGALYFSHGDGQAVGTTTNLEKATVLSSLDNPLGKLLRIDPSTGEGLVDNPFYIPGDPNNIQSKVYNYGLRNPWRYALHPDTDEPFMGDVGLLAWEEINRGIGQYFGWSLYEGGNGVSLRSESPW